MAPLNPKVVSLLLRMLTGQQLHDRGTHEQLCKALLGDEYSYVHRFKDRPARYLGKKHRVLFHDHATNLILGLASKDPKAFLAAELHDAMDRADTRLRYPKRRPYKY